MFTLDSRPRGLRYLYVAVAGHCFAWYTLFNLFVFWLVSRGDSPAHAAAQFGNLIAAAYLMPLLGGLIADGVKWRTVVMPGLGLRKAALLGSLCGLAGFVALALSPSLPPVLFITLAVGLVKPTLANMVGRVFPSGSALADAAFGRYYSAINVGAVASPVVGGAVSVAYGFPAAFGVATVGYVVAVAALALGYKHLAATEQPSSLAAVVGEVVPGPGYSDAVAQQQPDVVDSATQRRRLVALWAFFALAAVAFWPSYAQNGSGLNLWALEHTDRALLHRDVPAAWFAAINSVLCIVGSSWIVSRVARTGLSLSTSTTLGYVLMAASFLILVAAPQSAASPGYLVAAITLSSLSEILISTIGLAQVAKLAPRARASLYMALWYCTVAVGGKLAGLGAALPLRMGFATLAVLCLAAGALAVALRHRLDVVDGSVAATASKLHAEAAANQAHAAHAARNSQRLRALTVRLLDDVVPVEGGGVVLLAGSELRVVSVYEADGEVRGWWCRRRDVLTSSEWLIFKAEAEVVTCRSEGGVVVGEFQVA